MVELRLEMIGGKIRGEKPERVLNEYAPNGWVVEAITAAELKGCVGPGGVSGILVTCEKP